MQRRLVIGRLGADDQVVIPTAPSEIAGEVQLVSGVRSLDHGLGHALADAAAMNLSPSEIGVDLLILASLVYAADTRISRDDESQDSWTREIRLVVPVSDPARWIAAAPTLVSALNFLTGDRWIVDFRARPARFATMAPAPTDGLLGHPFNALSLFSGGLDSLIGAIDLLHAGRTPLLVSHAGEGTTSTVQEGLFASLKHHYSTLPVERLRMWMSFGKNLLPQASPESTTRGRSFLFFSLGVFAGTGFGGQFELRVPENGLIALNVPLDFLRLGSNSTRTTHPFYIETWNRLLQDLGVPGRIVNPYWHLTKGEMARLCADPQFLRSVAAESMSCSSPDKFRYRGHRRSHCGYCLPCLIRRSAIEAAWGAGNDPTPYFLADLRAQPLQSSAAEGVQVRSFQVMIERLRANPGLASLLVHKPGPLSNQPAPIAQLADVFRRGIVEVGQLLNGVVTDP